MDDTKLVLPSSPPFVNINTKNAGGSIVDYIRSLQYGANINQGPAHAESRYYGRTRIYSTNPGW